jgi:hypothetical protein
MLPTLGDALQESWIKVSNRLRKKEKTFYPVVIPLDLVAELNDNSQTQISKFLFCLERTCISILGAKGRYRVAAALRTLPAPVEAKW